VGCPLPPLVPRRGEGLRTRNGESCSRHTASLDVQPPDGGVTLTKLNHPDIVLYGTSLSAGQLPSYPGTAQAVRRAIIPRDLRDSVFAHGVAPQQVTGLSRAEPVPREPRPHRSHHPTGRFGTITPLSPPFIHPHAVMGSPYRSHSVISRRNRGPLAPKTPQPPCHGARVASLLQPTSALQ